MAYNWVLYSTAIGGVRPEEVGDREGVAFHRFQGHPKGYFSGGVVLGQLGKLSSIVVLCEVWKA